MDSADTKRSPAVAPLTASIEEHSPLPKGQKADRCQEWGAFLGNESLSVAERLSLVLDIHAHLCESASHTQLQERVDELACPELLVPLLALARAPHPLGYVTLRLLNLFTHTHKGVSLLARLRLVGTVMTCLSRPQELESIRYCVDMLAKIASCSSCRGAETRSEIASLDPRILLHLLTSDIFHGGQMASSRCSESVPVGSKPVDSLFCLKHPGGPRS